jgi:DNA segregation ATPase FtsK/SpoIIIE, S-DNA-T family
MTDLTVWLEATGALAGAGGVGLAKVRAPRLYWATVGLPVTWCRFAGSYRSTMDVCGLTVQPSGLRAFMARTVVRREVQPVAPKIRRIRGTMTGLRVTLRLPAGLEPADVIASTERLRHAWGVHAVTVVETKPGFVELRMTGYDVLRRVRMPRNARPYDMIVPVAVREDGTAFERDYRKAPMALTLGANFSGKSMYQRNLVKGLAQLPVALVGIDCKRGVEQSAFAPPASRRW